MSVDGEPVFENPDATAKICLVRGTGDAASPRTKVRDQVNVASTLRPGLDVEFLTDLLARFEVPMDKPSKSLSQGKKCALGVAMGLASRVPVTIFDESYLGLDAPSRYVFYDVLLADVLEHPRTVIISTHLIEEVAARPRRVAGPVRTPDFRGFPMTRRMPMLRILLTAHLTIAAITWTVLLVGTLVLVAVFNARWDVDRSVWHYVATQTTRWIPFALGVDAITTNLRQHLAHGRTRSEFLRLLVPYFLGLATFLGLLITLGYLIERWVYAGLEWPRTLQFKASFDDPGNYAGIFGAYTLTMLLWAAAGVLLAAAFTRKVALGLAIIPFAVLLVAPSEVLVGLNGVPKFTELLEEVDFPQQLGAILAPAFLALAGLAMWAIVRRAPLRPRA